jgi:hypothetical protein
MAEGRDQQHRERKPWRERDNDGQRKKKDGKREKTLTPKRKRL